MRLSTRGRYAVSAMSDLAVEGGGRPVSLARIAGRQAISLAYLEQLFVRLRRSGLVESVRGPGGGYRLARAAEEIRIAEIVGSVGEPLRITRCLKGDEQACTGRSGRCLTHNLWAGLGRHIAAYLRSVRLSDVIEARLPDCDPAGFETPAEGEERDAGISGS